MNRSIREVRAAGRDALMLATGLLNRARLADPTGGVWEAADVQWWWREPRPSDGIEQLFWTNNDGPIGGVLLTAWETDSWQCDPIIVPGSGLELETVWARTWDEIHTHVVGEFDVPVLDDDLALTGLVEKAGLVPGERSSIAWMDAADRPGVRSLPEGFTIVDQTGARDEAHPMQRRNGAAIRQRLAQCPLYDPELDLAVETDDGEIAGYSLYWLDPATQVGLVEPVRVEDGYQRRGLARAMLAAGIERLAAKGATRVKIGYGTEAAENLYRSVGFVPTSTDTWYAGRCDAAGLREVERD